MELSARLEFINGVTNEFLSETLSLLVVGRERTVTTILRQYRALIHEAHLLGVGLKTTAQLQAFREEFQCPLAAAICTMTARLAALTLQRLPDDIELVHADLP